VNPVNTSLDPQRDAVALLRKLVAMDVVLSSHCRWCGKDMDCISTGHPPVAWECLYLKAKELLASIDANHDYPEGHAGL
jgi:hypothetical protein